MLIPIFRVSIFKLNVPIWIKKEKQNKNAKVTLKVKVESGERDQEVCNFFHEISGYIMKMDERLLGGYMSWNISESFVSDGVLGASTARNIPWGGYNVAIASRRK